MRRWANRVQLLSDTSKARHATESDLRLLSQAPKRAALDQAGLHNLCNEAGLACCAERPSGPGGLVRLDWISCEILANVLKTMETPSDLKLPLGMPGNASQLRSCSDTPQLCHRCLLKAEPQGPRLWGEGLGWGVGGGREEREEREEWDA